MAAARKVGKDIRNTRKGGRRALSEQIGGGGWGWKAGRLGKLNFGSKAIRQALEALQAHQPFG